MTKHMVDIIDKVKSGEINLENPEDTIVLMMDRMGVNENDVDDLIDMFFEE